MLDIPLLKRLSETPGAPGFEQPIRKLIEEEMRPFCDELFTDNIGNLYALRRGRSRSKMMLAAHIDEIGFIVTHIDDKGFVRFIPLGGFDPKTLASQRVIVHGRQDLIGVMGTKPIHLMSPEERSKGVEIKDFFIDLGMPKEQVSQLVRVGDPVTRQRELIEMGDCINGKSLDNRISAFVLIQAMKQLAGQELPLDTYAVFTVQEEVGIRGAQAAALNIEPQYALAIDTTIAFDVPGSQPHEQVSQLGAGAAIKIMDSSVICDLRMRSYLNKLSESQGIKCQTEMLPAGGTDTSALQRMVRGGSIAGAISIPTRHIHQVIETVHKLDVEAAIQLTVAAIKELDSFNTDWIANV